MTDELHPVVMPFRVAVLDLGSNAIRVVVAEFGAPGRFDVLLSERLPIRLGGGSFDGEGLAPEKVEETISALAALRPRLDGFGVSAIRAVATSAVREASNRGVLIAGVRERAGIEIEAISGEEEGSLVWEALRAGLSDPEEPWLLADLGGGSLELSLAEGGELRWTRSLPLGTVRLLRALEQSGTGSSLEEISAFIDGRIGSVEVGEPRELRGVTGLLASGGNAEVLAQLASAPEEVGGLRYLSLERLRELTSTLAAMSCEERMRRFDLRPDRADVIVPAGVVLTRLAERVGADGLHLARAGLKEGVLLRLAADVARGGVGEEQRFQVVECATVELGRRLRFDEAHARQVTRFALRLFDDLRHLHRLDGRDRLLLMAAAMLHDSGKLISTSRHHKHSRYLILNCGIEGLDEGELEIVGMIARYHRGSRPRKTHGRYGELDPSDRKRVKKLASLLRIADGLDSDHDQKGSQLSVHEEPGDGAERPGKVIVRLCVPELGEPTVWSLNRGRQRLFEKVFSRTIEIRAIPDPATPSPVSS